MTQDAALPGRQHSAPVAPRLLSTLLSGFPSSLFGPGLSQHARLIRLDSAQEAGLPESLAAPLQLGTKEASNGLLPVGTTLYYDTSFPEGFSRYKIYVNIDRMPLPLENLPDPTMITPLDAAPFRQEALLELLRNHPLTRKDLDTILSTGYLSKDEIKEVLSEFVASR